MRDYVAWGRDRAQDPMPAVPFASARAYCTHVGRRLPSKAEAEAAGLAEEWVDDARRTTAKRAFRCVAARGAPALERPVAAAATPVSEVPSIGLNMSREEWPLEGAGGFIVVDDAGKEVCEPSFRRNYLRGLQKPGRTLSLEVRDNVLRFRDDAGDCSDDWAIGAGEYGPGIVATYVGGSPWFYGIECEAMPPAQFRPHRLPCSRRRPNAFFVDDRAFYVAQRGGKACARAGLQVVGRVSPVLRVEASEGDRFFAITDLTPDLVFVNALDEASAKAGLVPTGRRSLRSSAKGYRIGDTILYAERGTCESAIAAATVLPPAPDGEGEYRRRIFAAWAEFVKARSEVFLVAPSGETCERAALHIADASPFIGTIGPYAFDIDGDGIHLAQGDCREHYELTSYAADRWIDVGSSSIFATAEACERERAWTPPFAHRCTSRPPLLSDSLAARGKIDGFTRYGDGTCTATSLDFRTSFAVTSESELPPPLDGTWMLHGKPLDVVEWPWAHKLFVSNRGWKQWLSVEPRGPTAFAIGQVVIHSTLAACEAAR